MNTAKEVCDLSHDHFQTDLVEQASRRTVNDNVTSSHGEWQRHGQGHVVRGS